MELSCETTGYLPAGDMAAELVRIRERYARRRDGPPQVARSILAPEVILRHQERERAILYFLRRYAPRPIHQLCVLEIGCGFGGNLLQFLRWGCMPDHLVANELLEERWQIARRLLPAETAVRPGDASQLDLPTASFDIVFQSTVFSSILNPQFRQHLAEKMWHWVAPHGGVLWYDMRYNNPRNPDVRRISLEEIRRLFPEGVIHAKSITLAPPIARRVARGGVLLYTLLASIPWLRTHWLCWIGKGESIKKG